MVNHWDLESVLTIHQLHLFANYLLHRTGLVLFIGHEKGSDPDFYGKTFE